MKSRHIKLNRILFLTLIFLLAATISSPNYPVPSGQTAPPPLSVQKITGSIYLVKGGQGANTAIFLTPKNIIIIDAKMSAESAAGMVAEARKLSTAAIKTLIITHSDGDHINGLPGLPGGLTIISHEACRNDIEKAAENNPSLKNYIPNLVFSKEFRVPGLSPKLIRLLNFGPAHTNGDTIIWFPRDKTVFVGDLIFIGRDPLIHLHKGGNVYGYVNTLKKMLGLKPEIEIFLSGHADPVGRKEIVSLAASIEEKIKKIEAFIAEGKSLEEIKRVFGEEVQTDQPARRWRSLTETIYAQVMALKEK